MNIKNKAAGMLLLLSVNSAFAVESSGLMNGNKSDPYWFKVGGAIKVDTTKYFGKSSDRIGRFYHSGSIMRETSVKLEGGVGADYSFTLNLALSPSTSKINVDEGYLTYSGFKDLVPNFSISVGQVNPGFSLESTSSSKWTPFMEKSLGASIFGPHPGLGLSASSFTKDYSVTIAATNPKPSMTPLTNADGNNTSDHALYSARVTFSPINYDSNLAQIGVSTHYTDRNNALVNFSIDPETKTRSSTSLLNTGNISIKDQFAYDVELIAQRGPLYVEGEYQTARIKRGLVAGTVQGKNLKFRGYHAQVAYVLTGEARKRSDATATLGQIIPQHRYGAVEAAIRYSHLNLNDQDIIGGKANNITTSLSWYPNSNVRFIAEYVNSKQNRAPISMRVHSVGGRVQFIF